MGDKGDKGGKGDGSFISSGSSVFNFDKLDKGKEGRGFLEVEPAFGAKNDSLNQK